MRDPMRVDAPLLGIHLMGGFRVMVGGEVVEDSRWTRRAARSIVKLLALEPSRRLHRDVILEYLWPDSDLATALNAFHKALHAARHALEPSRQSGTPSRFLHTNNEIISLSAPGGLWVDVDAFAAALADARREPSTESFRSALRYYGGELLPEDRYEDWAGARREELDAWAIELLHGLAELETQRGRYLQAALYLQRAAAIDPLAEDIHARLIQAYVRGGYQRLALRQYERFRQILASEPDAQPGWISPRFVDDEDVIRHRPEPGCRQRALRRRRPV